MKRWALFTITLMLLSTLAFAQVVVTSDGQATSQGAAVPAAPVSPPLVTTPLIHLGTASTLPGSNSGSVGVPQPPSMTPIRPEIDLGQTAIYTGPNSAAATPDMKANAANATSTGAATTARVDLGVHSDTAASIDDGTNGRSLADIARENRQRMQNANARTFTNADVARVAGAGGVSGIAASSANNGYPLNNGQINNNAIAAPADSQAPGAVAAPSNETNVPPATEQNAQPPAPASAEPANSQQKPSAGASVPHQMAQAQTPVNPADQDNAQSSASGGENGTQRTLPKSASFLPLMALVGIAATAAGLLAKK